MDLKPPCACRYFRLSCQHDDQRANPIVPSTATAWKMAGIDH